MSAEQPLPLAESPVERDGAIVRCVVVYNPLDVSQRSVFDLAWRPMTPLSVYLDGLPDHVDWHCQVNDALAPKAGWALFVPKPDDCIVLIPVPHGGGGNSKNILMIVATLALAIAAPYAGAALATAMGYSATGTAAAILTGVVSVAGGMLIRALAPTPKTPNIGQSEQDGATFGIDGPKNTATEGIPVPIVYGQRRVGGNYGALYTENLTDAEGKSVQYLFGQLILSEGEIESISDIEINGQAATTFDGVEFEKAYGTEVQRPGEWFNQVVSLYSIGRAMDENWDSYTTTGPVDALRVDIVAPTGLMTIDQSTGKRSEASVPIQIQWSPTGLNQWTDFLSLAYVDNVSNTVFDEPATGFRANAKITATVTSTTTVTARLDYRRVGDPSWIPLEEQSATIHPRIESRGGGEGFEYYLSTSASFSWVKSGLAEDVYEVRVVRVGGEGGEGGESGAQMVNLDRYDTAPIAISDKTRNATRRTYVTHRLPQGVYDVRWRRTTPESTSDYLLDALVAADIGEILMEEVALIHTAWLGFKILMSGQLNAIPTVTALVRGVKVDVYNDVGEVVSHGYSNNPADISLNINLNRRYGAGMDPDQIDFPAFAEWREHCVDHGYAANMVFDYHTNIHEAQQHILACGRAQHVSAGSRVSVAIDRRDTPVMVFGAGNIIRDSFEITYLPFDDRINEVEVEFPDANDNYRMRSIRVPDDEALATGAQLRPTTIRLPAITSATRAFEEGWLRLMLNRLVIRSIRFDASVEAIGCTVGDVITVQHDMPKWDVGGRLAAGSTTTRLRFDRPATMEIGKDYAALVMHNALKRYTLPISTQVGRSVFVTGLPANYRAVRRFVANGKDVGIEVITQGGTGASEILLEPGAEEFVFSGNCELWDTDVIEKRDVIFPAGQVDPVVEYLEADVATPFSQAPAAYSNFLFGERTTVGRLYRVMEIGAGTSELVYRISALEYHEEIYTTEVPVPANLEYPAGPAPAHVTGLVVREEVDLTLNLRRSKVQASWVAPTDNYGGAIVEARVNGGQWLQMGRTTSATVFEFEGDVGDVIDVRVISVSFKDVAAPKQTAPVASITLVGFTGAPAAPTGFSVTPGGKSITVSVNPHPAPDFKEFRVYMRDDGGALNETTDQVLSFIGTSGTVNNLDSSKTYSVWVQAVNTSGVKSAAVGPLTAQPLSYSGDVVNLDYTGADNIPFTGSPKLTIMSFNVMGANTATRVDVNVTSSLTLRRTEYGAELHNDYKHAVVDVARKPFSGGSATSLKTKVASVSSTSPQAANFSHSDTPGAGDWTYEIRVYENGSSSTIFYGGNGENALGDLHTASLAATITR